MESASDNTRQREESADADQLRFEEEMERISSGIVGRDDLVAAVLTIGESRRAQADRLLWEIPALGLTAQAFLSTIALDPSATNAARFAASLTALIFIGAAFQSLLKHRYHEGMWARWLELFERQATLPHLNSPSTVVAVARSAPNPSLEEPPWLYKSPLYLLKPRGLGHRVFRGSAFRVWAAALVVVIVIDFSMVAMALLGMVANVSSPFAGTEATVIEKRSQSVPAQRPTPTPRASQDQRPPSPGSGSGDRSSAPSQARPSP